MHNENVNEYINSHNLIGIKAGIERNEFLEIWMVVVDNRIFARSWGLAEKSWYNSFLKDNKGQIKCGDYIYNIEARIPTDLEMITDEINIAYLHKYNFGENAYYAQGIVTKVHEKRTMEFNVVD